MNRYRMARNRRLSLTDARASESFVVGGSVAVRREQALIHRAAMRSAEAAIVSPGERLPRRFGAATGGSVIIAVVALTVVAAVALLTGHRGPAAAAAGPVAASTLPPGPGLSPSPPQLSAPPSAPPPSSPGPSSATPLAAWQHSGILIVDESTGASYVYVSGRLHPPLNAASEDLILGTPTPRRVTVAHATIVAARPGPELGIVGAPVLPAAGSMLGGDLVICSASGQATTSIVFASAAGQADSGFVGYGGLSGGDGLNTNALIVSNRGADYLVWNRVRHPISDPAKVFAAYKWSGVVAVAVPDDVLAALPGGATISPTALTLKPPKPLHLAAPATLCVSVDRAGAATHTMINPMVTVGAGTFVLPTAGAMLLKASASASTVDLIMAGTYFPITGGKAALASLGYGSAPVMIAPASVLGLLGSGPTLSRTAAVAG